MKDTLLYVDSCAWFPYSKELHAQMVRTSRFDEVVDVGTIRHHPSHGQVIGVPREWIKDWKGTLFDQRVEGERIQWPGPCQFPPRNNEQAKVIVESVYHINHDHGFIVEASTGFGKTYCAINTIREIGRKTLVVVTKEDALVKWPKEIERFFNVPRSRIGIVQGPKLDYEGKDVVVAMVHTLAQKQFPDDFKNAFGLVLFDEVHHMAADTFQIAAAMFAAKYRVGYSATVNRVDGKDFVFHGHIGKPLVKAKLIPVPPKVLIKKSGWRLPRVPRRTSDGQLIKIQMPHEAGKLTHIVKAMARNQSRNLLLVSYIKEAYRKGRWVLVLSELGIDMHLGILRQMCNDVGIPDSDMAYYVGGLSEKAREEAKTKHVVFATYGMTAEETDVPWWDCAIFATPRANIVQPAGRVLREHPGKPQPIIIDIVDDDSTVLEGYSKARIKQYTSSEMKGQVIYL